jgi:hypothetical protein
MAEGQLPPPVVLTLLIADNHILDHRWGQHSVIGIFSQVKATTFPLTLSRLCIYAELSNGRGPVPIQIRIIDAAESRTPVIDAVANITFADPLDVGHLAFGAMSITFPAPGDYRVQLLAHSVLLAERRLNLVQVAPGPASGQSTSEPTPPAGPLPPGTHPGWIGG